MNVPASMRSGIMETDTGLSEETPCMVISEVPAPLISAPILIKTSASAIISGSRAALPRTVTPSDRTAAIIRFSVPVTVDISK